MAPVPSPSAKLHIDQPLWFATGWLWCGIWKGRGMEVRRAVAEDKGYVCWAWWRTDDKPGHHRCMLPSGHPGLHECCCGAQIYDFGAGRDKVRAKLGKGECILTAAVTRAGTGT